MVPQSQRAVETLAGKVRGAWPSAVGAMSEDVNDWRGGPIYSHLDRTAPATVLIIVAVLDPHGRCKRDPVVVVDIRRVLKRSDVESELAKESDTDAGRSMPHLPGVTAATPECERAEPVLRAAAEVQAMKTAAHFGDSRPPRCAVACVAVKSNGK